MEVALTFVGLLLAMFLFYVVTKQSRPKDMGKLIPGPGFIDGVKVFIKGTPQTILHLEIEKWVPIYGPLMRINLGITKMVFFNDAKTFIRFVNESPTRKISNDRSPSFVGKYILENYRDIVFVNYNTDLKAYRKIFHSLLKFYGEGVGEMEQLLTQTLQDLQKKLALSENVDISYLVRRYILNVLRILMTGDTLHDVKGNLDVLQDFNDALNGVTNECDMILGYFPFLRFLPGTTFKTVSDNMSKTKDALMEMYLKTMRESHVPGQRRGMIDDLISLEENYLKDSGEVKVDEGVVKALIMDIIVAGYLTTSNTLCALLLNIIHNQDVQQRLYKDITEVMGNDDPGMEHRKQLPYVEAVIQETFRIQSLLPFLVDHAVREDTVFDGFFFPKGTICMMNAWYSHHNEDIWKDPWNFRPERFLDDNGELLDLGHPLRDNLLPFGKGRRACPGESFARFRLFIMLTTLVKEFALLPPDPPAKLPPADPRTFVGVGVIQPPDFLCKAVKRNGDN